MTPILDRIRAHGGEVIRSRWNITLRRGRLKPEAVAWISERRDSLLREVWPEADLWDERAAIMEYDGGLSRDEAEAAAYADVCANA